MEAVKLIEQKRFGVSLVLNGPQVGSVSIDEAVAQPRMVQPDSQIVQTARELGIIFGDRSAAEMAAEIKGKAPAAKRTCKSKSAKPSAGEGK